MLGCVKYLVILYNLLLWLLGLTILGLSIFFYVDTLKYIDFSASSWPIYSTLFLVIIATGLIMTIVGFFGCCGAIKESTCMLVLYFIICIIVCAGCGAAIFLAEQNTLPVKGYLQEDLKKIIQKNYVKNNDSSVANMLVDRIQTDFQCCGSSNYTDWIESLQNNSTGRLDVGVMGRQNYISAAFPQGQRTQTQFSYNTANGQSTPGPQSRTTTATHRVPISCCSNRADNLYNECKLSIERTDNSSNKNYAVPNVNIDGCVDKVHAYLESNSLILIIIGGVCIGLQFLAILFSCALCCAIGRPSSEDKRVRQ